ncbi:alkaline phosphatase family protein [Limnobacter humi]|uniref:Alkaline phosphatase family protein n=1 Tax=Limnobacter humi TaxID=1778671 RepID=A0ABT1WHG4_9BURK|nr:alkaline phosphatase D family protein [Limnobacter humi]MCQ8896974.1 alkaline phosphatase family protein [Limnobacter humi]
MPNTNTLMLGPLLGLESDTLYTVCFAAPTTVQQASVRLQQGGQATDRPAQCLSTTAQWGFWRADIQVPTRATAQQCAYAVLLDGVVATSQQGLSQWVFEVPGNSQAPRLAYASCNGFSDPKLMKNTAEPFALWKKLLNDHAKAPIHLLLMGGDQVYADSLWGSVPLLKRWSALPKDQKCTLKPASKELAALQSAYVNLYLERWNEPSTAQALATIPSLMMWDDHDIVDGWGSYSDDLQQSPVMQAAFQAANTAFQLFQLRGRSTNTTLLAPQAAHHSALLRFRGLNILALDNRSDRCLNRIMSEPHWQTVINTLNTLTNGDLLVMSGVPVVYRDFSFVEQTLDTLPGDQELTDDLKDHWRARAHQGERARFIMRLLDNARQRKARQHQARTVILSGDVHVGCLGVVQDTTGHSPVNLHQVVSSGIVHPAPNALQWAGILATTNDRDETLDENGHVRSRMLTPFGSSTYLRTRNYATLQEGTDGKLWVNWVCENGNQPHYPLA